MNVQKTNARFTTLLLGEKKQKNIVEEQKRKEQRGKQMSLGRELMYEFQAGLIDLEAKIEHDALIGIWVTKDGREVPVSDMSDEHIKNSISMLKRNDYCDLYLPWIDRFEKELEKRKNTNG